MSTKRISQEKVERVSLFMVRNKFDDEIQKTKELIESKIYTFLSIFIDEDVLNNFDPYYYSKLGSISIYSDCGKGNYLFSYHPNLPKVNPGFKEEDFSRNKELNQRIENDVNKYLSLVKEKQVMKNKIACALSGLKTYSKIKNEFPEAYIILVEKVDGITKEKDSCTNIEELRAELTTK